jgi:hypothetical protein
MTRQEIIEQYKVDANGIIRSPGKFEAEMLYAPYFYDVMLNGATDHVNGVDYVELDATDREQFPELGTAYGIALEESEQGFVHITVLNTKGEYEQDITAQSNLGGSECE